jgi:hypothetical protein
MQLQSDPAAAATPASMAGGCLLVVVCSHHVPGNTAGTLVPRTAPSVCMTLTPDHCRTSSNVHCGSLNVIRQSSKSGNHQPPTTEYLHAEIAGCINNCIACDQHSNAVVAV